MHKIPRTVGIFASGGALIAAALTTPSEAPGSSWAWADLAHLALPLSLFVYARCWLDEGRARERRARGIPEDG